MQYSDKEMTESNNPPLNADGKPKNCMQFMKFLRILNKQQVTGRRCGRARGLGTSRQSG